jgi:hypothetical protein
MRALKYLALAAALSTSGCKDETPAKPDAAVNPDGGGTANPDGGTANPDGGMANPDGGTASITLVEWVSDLVEHYNTPTSAPDTVEDKHVTDTSDPAAFDKLLGQ